MTDGTVIRYRTFQGQRYCAAIAGKSTANHENFASRRAPLAGYRKKSRPRVLSNHTRPSHHGDCL